MLGQIPPFVTDLDLLANSPGNGKQLIKVYLFTLFSRKTLTSQVVLEKNICKRKNEVKPAALTGKLLLERKIEVTDRKYLMPLRYLVYSLDYLIHHT